MLLWIARLSSPCCVTVAAGRYRLMSAMASFQGTWWHPPSDRCARLPSCIGGSPTGSKPCIPIACSTMGTSSSVSLTRQDQVGLRALLQGHTKQMPSGLCHPTSLACLPSTIQRQPCQANSNLEYYQPAPAADQRCINGSSLRAVLLPSNFTKDPKLGQTGARVKLQEAGDTCRLQSFPTKCNSAWPLFWSLWALVHLPRSPQLSNRQVLIRIGWVASRTSLAAKKVVAASKANSHAC